MPRLTIAQLAADNTRLREHIASLEQQRKPAAFVAFTLTEAQRIARAAAAKLSRAVAVRPITTPRGICYEVV